MKQMIDEGTSRMRRCRSDSGPRTTRSPRMQSTCALPARRWRLSSGDTIYMCDVCDHEPPYKPAR